jgi:hypothetical protein
MSETLNNDSTKKQLGFEYQKLIALEHCLIMVLIMILLVH